MSFDAREFLASLTELPGVYRMLDAAGSVLYVGKAKNLKRRVSSYFQKTGQSPRIALMLQQVARVETTATRSEAEALILENNLIKQYKPRYNIRLKDDKSYVSVKVTVQDAWPRVLVTRKIVKDGSKYFGPYHSAISVRERTSPA